MLANQRSAQTPEVQSQISSQSSLPLTQVSKKSGETLNRCPGFMTTPETERYLYPNLSYFLNLSSRSGSPYCYFGTYDDEGYMVPYPATWGTDNTAVYDEEHPSNPENITPTFHELDVVTSVFGTKLYGTFKMKDTRVSEENPPLSSIQFDWGEDDNDTQKEKIPPGWRKTLSKDKNRYFYWNEKTRKSQWGHPWPTMMHDLQHRIHMFRDITENYKHSIHSNMDLKGQDFYSFIGAEIGTYGDRQNL